MQAQPTLIRIDESASVSGALMAPPRARSIFVFAHGAGADMSHTFMEQTAAALAARDVATLRFNFPFMEHAGERRFARPDVPATAHATVRAAIAHARTLAPEMKVFAGGKSFGARMTSQAFAERSIAEVSGLVFLGFPLHAAGKPSTIRAAHLREVRAPMLFVQGTRDTLADLTLVRERVRVAADRAAPCRGRRRPWLRRARALGTQAAGGHGRGRRHCRAMDERTGALAKRGCRIRCTKRREEALQYIEFAPFSAPITKPPH